MCYSELHFGTFECVQWISPKLVECCRLSRVQNPHAYTGPFRRILKYPNKETKKKTRTVISEVQTRTRTVKRNIEKKIRRKTCSIG